MNLNVKALSYRINPDLPDWMQPGYMPCDDDDNFALEDDTSIEGLLCPSSEVGTSDDYDYSMSDPEESPVIYTGTSLENKTQTIVQTPIVSEENLKITQTLLSSVPRETGRVKPETIVQTPSAVVSALLSVGVSIPPYSASIAEVPQLVDCDFADLSRHYMIVGESTVVSWDVPRDNIPYLNRIVGEECVRAGNYRVLDVQRPLAGLEWRPKPRGVIAAQIVAHTSTGEQFSWLWYDKICRKVIALTSALYYCQAPGTPMESFILRSGEAAQDLVSVPLEWFPVYHQTLLDCCDHDDLIIRYNSIEYILKMRKIIKLHINSGRGFDLDGVSYDIKGAPDIDTMAVAEVRWRSASVLEFSSWRPDLTRADTTVHIRQVIESLTVLEFLDLITSSTTLSTGLPQFSCIRDIHPYGNVRGLTPFSIDYGHPLLPYIKHLIHNTRTHFGELRKNNMNCSIYSSEVDSHRKSFETLYRPTRGKLWCICTRQKWYYTLVPVSTTTRIIIRHISNCSRILLNRLKGCVQDIYGERFLVFYASLDPYFKKK